MANKTLVDIYKNVIEFKAKNITDKKNQTYPLIL